jgi:hypothetical protein
VVWSAIRKPTPFRRCHHPCPFGYQLVRIQHMYDCSSAESLIARSENSLFFAAAAICCALSSTSRGRRPAAVGRRIVLLILLSCAMLEAQTQSDVRTTVIQTEGHEVFQYDRWAQMSETSGEALGQTSAQRTSNKTQTDWVNSWLRRVDAARASQPHFTAPIVTTHVMLVQQYRYDMSWQQDTSGGTVTSNYGASRGLEIIPTTRLEVGISPPNYLVHESSQPDGIGDLAWQVKFRAFSATEHQGDYFVGFFLGGTFPTGDPPNGTGHTILTPTFAAAKGIGPWDIQSTIGGNLPMSGASTLGRTIVFNTEVNYRIKGTLWPMLEQNSTFAVGGTSDGKKVVFLTPGVVVGSFPLAKRLRFAIGSGFQTAVTSYHPYNHRWILSVRFPF